SGEDERAIIDVSANAAVEIRALTAGILFQSCADHLAIAGDFGRVGGLPLIVDAVPAASANAGGEVVSDEKESQRESDPGGDLTLGRGRRSPSPEGEAEESGRRTNQRDAEEADSGGG